MSVPALIATAQARATAIEDRITQIKSAISNGDTSGPQTDELHATIAELALVAVDTFSLFEARMQHHFRRGPFSRKLKALLLEAGQTDLAEKFHHYYLAINVLKHGKGASYRELLATPSAPIIVKTDNDKETESLIDITVPEFFDDLAATILAAYHFLENKQ